MLSRSFSPPSHRRSPKAGFALLLVLGLLSLVVLVLVSLAAYTKVETSITGVGQRQAQARQNALFALDQAIGLLQRSAGPDTRVTATADINSANTGQPYWTGVWDTSNPANPPIWLVNGWDQVSTTRTTPLVNRTPSASPTDPRTESSTPNPRWVWMLRKPLQGTSATLPLATNPAAIILEKSPIAGTGVPGFPASASRTTGSYAFWVSDQGVKAPVSHFDRTLKRDTDLTTPPRVPAVTFTDGAFQRDFSPGLLTTGAAEFDSIGDYNRQRTRLMIAQEGRFDLVLDPTGLVGAVNTFELLRKPEFDAAESARQVVGLETTQARRDALTDRLALRYHDIADANWGVLADTANGGLRRIVDTGLGFNAVDPSFDGYQGFLDAANLFAASALGRNVGFAGAINATAVTVPPSYGAPATLFAGTAQAPGDFTNPALAGRPVFITAPIISRMRITYRVGSDAVPPSLTGQLALNGYDVVAEFWNPYSVELAGGDYRIDLNTAPVLEIRHSGSATGETMDLSAIPEMSSFTFTVPHLAPGRSQKVPTSSPSIAPRLFAPVVTLPLTGYTWPSTGFNVMLNTLPALPALPQPLRFYGGIQTPAQVRSPPTANQFEFTFEWRLADHLDSAAPARPWLARYNPNSPTVLQSNVSGEPVLLPADASSPWVYNGAITHPDRLNHVSLFDLPRQAVLSTGSLRHVALMPLDFSAANPNAPAYALGSAAKFQTQPGAPGTETDLLPIAGAVPPGNVFFDRVYATALPRFAAGATSEANSTYQGAAFPNGNVQIFAKDGDERSSRPRVLQELAQDGTTASKWLLVRNMFNINSTSVAAWRSLLGGANLTMPATITSLQRDTQFNYDDGISPAPSAANLKNLFSRFPQGVQSIREPIGAAPTRGNVGSLRASSGSGDEPDSNLFGLRALTDAEVDLLASAIVAEIRLAHPYDINGDTVDPTKPANQPFGSLAQFITSGVLERAINSVSATANTMNQGLQPRAPFTLTQGDILERIAPQIAARSDTFVVRAYGETGNPAEAFGTTDFSTGEAWLEAVVQRCPDYVSQADSNLTAADASIPDVPVNLGLADPRDASPSDFARSVGTTNQNHGRRFRILSIRWLNPDEI